MLWPGLVETIYSELKEKKLHGVLYHITGESLLTLDKLWLES